MTEKTKTHIFLKYLKRSIVVLFFIFVALILFIKSSWGQDIITSKAVNYVANKTNTKVEIEKLYLSFSGNLVIENLFLEDKKKDTLLYSKNLEASIALWPLIKGNTFNLKSLKWDGLKVNVYRKDTIASFNYNFLIDAFATTDTVTTTATNESLKIKLGDIELKNIDIKYYDDVLGIESNLNLNAINLETNTFDLDQMDFDIETLQIKNSTVKYKQTKPFTSSSDETESQSPLLAIQNLDIENTKIYYASVPDYQDAKVIIDGLYLKMPVLDLEKQVMNVTKFDLENSNIAFQQLAPLTANNTETPSAFEWPKWDISASSLNLSNNSISAKTGQSISEKNVLNPEDLQFSNLNFQLNSLIYKPENVSVTLENISFIERSGFQLKKLATEITLNNNYTNLKNLIFNTKSNNINGNISVNYENINAFINHPDSSQLSLSISNLSINPKDAYYFLPELKKNNYLTALSEKQITGTLNINGSIDNLNIPATAFNWGDTTKLLLEGNIKNALDNDKLSLDFKNFEITSTKKDALPFIESETLNIDLPEKFKLKGNINGGLTNISTNAALTTSDGNITLKGHLKNGNSIAFKGTFNVDDLALGKITKNENLGIYSFTTSLNGEGSNINTLDADLETSFKKLSYNNYDFSQLNLDGKLRQGKGDINLGFKDENLDFNLINSIQLDSVASKIHSVLNLNGIDLQALGITQNDMRGKFNLELDIEGNSNSDLNLKGEITDAMSIKNGKPFTIGNINFNTALTDKTTDFKIESTPINATLNSNTDVASLIEAIQNQLNSYFDKTDVIATKSTDTSSIAMSFNATVKQAPIFQDLFLPQLESLEPIAISVDFNSQNNTLKARANSPQLTYNGNTIDSLNLVIDAQKNSLNYNFDLGNLKTEALAIQKINLKGNLKDKVLYSNFIALDKTETLIQINSEITKYKDSLNFHINPESLIINKQNWTILPENQITSSTNFLGFKDFKLSYNNQEISISNTLPEKTVEHLGFNFKNFELSTITSLFNQEKLLASGRLNGDVILENPLNDIGMLANAKVEKLKIMEVPFGTLNLSAKSLNASKYDLNLNVLGDNLNLDIKGEYTAKTDEAALNFDVNLKNLELKAVEQFTESYISKTSGNLSGKIKLSGSTVTPKLLGAVNFNDAGLTVNAFNSSFLLPKESIKMDENGIYFDTFTMLDTNKNPFVVDGNIDTENLTNPGFNLTLKAKNIEVLNSTKEDNDLFYGKVNLDTDISVNGTLQLPKVRGSLVVNETSNFTYVVPEDEVNLVEKAGVVVFVNKKNPDDILTKQKEDVSSTAVLKGYDINAQLSVSKKAIANIIIDEGTGDNLQISGTGNFNFGIAENGDMSLSGKYEVNNGHYEVSLYNLVKRHFDIAKGSSITWRGNPFEADMDMRAIYNIEASAYGLMAAQLTGESTSVTSKYNQKLPFLVYLNLNGQLLKPEISFNLDIPKDSQGELGGAVYAQVQQLNTEEEDLNKQVFSLLVLNQFFPTSSSDGSNGGSLSIARDNANNVLSNQLNNFSNKLLGKTGIELDFGINSYTDYQGDAPTNKTQLDVNASKKLLNDRLIVEVGSGVDIQENSDNAGETTPLVGTVNIQYLFDDNGRWRLKAYRKNDFDNIIDGQIILTGISLIFNQEFNKFEELFAKEVKKEIEKTKDTKSKKDNQN